MKNARVRGVTLLYPEFTATLTRNQSATDFYRDLPP